jgi:hypothetical protein
MGYNYHVSSVGVESASNGQVNVDVTLNQIGVAPFYYDISLAISCAGMNKKSLSGVESLYVSGDSKVFSFTGIPTTKECLDALTLSLESSYVYAGRPIKFAQGNGQVSFALPLPSGTSPPPPPPVALPVSPPVAPPVSPPVASPVSPPIVTTDSASVVVGFVLVNADTDTAIGPLANGGTVSLANAKNLNVEAVTNPSTVASVRFSYDGNASYRTERMAPYALAGNMGSDWLAWTPTLGPHTITATALDASDKQLGSKTVTFTVV